MKQSLFDNWPRLTFVYLPLLIAIAAAGVLVHEQRQPDTVKAIRLVRENNSRKENFTIQQYLYSTVFYRQRQGEPLQIEGWHAAETSTPDPITVEFSYSDAAGRHTASWGVDWRAGSVRPLNDNARELSWH